MSALAAHGDALVTIFALAGLIVWIDVRNQRAFRSIETALKNIAARLEFIEARFAASDAKKNGADVLDHRREGALHTYLRQ
jgi:hypothetical protein